METDISEIRSTKQTFIYLFFIIGGIINEQSKNLFLETTSSRQFSHLRHVFWIR